MALSNRLFGGQGRARGFSAAITRFEGFRDQSVAALATPLPKLTTPHLWHTQSHFGRLLARPCLRLQRYDFAVRPVCIWWRIGVDIEQRYLVDLQPTALQLMPDQAVFNLTQEKYPKE